MCHLVPSSGSPIPGCCVIEPYCTDVWHQWFGFCDDRQILVVGDFLDMFPVSDNVEPYKMQNALETEETDGQCGSLTTSCRRYIGLC